MISQKVKDYVSIEGEDISYSLVYQEEKNNDNYSKTKYGICYTSSELEMNILQEDSSESTIVSSSSVSSRDFYYGLRRMLFDG